MTMLASTALEPGRGTRFGATPTPAGIEFAVFSRRASAIELCLFDAGGTVELARHALHGPDDGVFHGLLRGAGPGLVYGLRAHGRYAPETGRRFNPAKLLLDPYAREVVGRFAWQPEHYDHVRGHPHGVRTPDTRDNAATALKARVLADPGPAPGAANRPRHAAGQRVLYELHVRGFTMSLPGIPESLRGTFAALAHPVAIAHLRRIGVTTLSLLPVQQWLDEPHLARRGLSNFWGYNPIAHFCPEPRLAHDRAPGAAVAEFRNMVATLHDAGLEVLIDVVFNHTAEGDESGPTLSFRGLDHASWYWLAAEDRSRCENFSGCGNSLRLIHPRVTQYVLDALRYWFGTMGVDGFRFDLATTLGRTRHGFDPVAPFFVALAQDPLLAEAVLIAEPWDAGAGGYQLGRFPDRFLEWNDRYRDAVRGYWLGKGVTRGEFARRVTASSDLFHHGGRGPLASVNFVTAHDGFTLADLVSYSHRHNEANGEDNRDGHAHEVSDNLGCEGPSADPALVATRTRVRRALLATLLLSQGTPMLRAGDEFGDSQRGNNNAYCQDNAIGWLDWDAAPDDAGTTALVARLIALRRQHPLLRVTRWFVAADEDATQPRLAWYNGRLAPMRDEEWHERTTGAFACLVHGPGERAPRYALLFNPDPEPHPFVLAHGPWRLLLDSSAPERAPAPAPFDRIDAPARSVLLLASADSAAEDCA